jgi:hypothetical protein
LDDDRRRAVLRVCIAYRRGMFSANDACSLILFSFFETSLAADYVALLPDELRAALVTFLSALPTSEEEWAHFRGIGQLDGNEWTWARTIVECRANTEAARTHLFGVTNPAVSEEFIDRVRTAYRERLANVGSRRT